MGDSRICFYKSQVVPRSLISLRPSQEQNIWTMAHAYLIFFKGKRRVVVLCPGPPHPLLSTPVVIIAWIVVIGFLKSWALNVFVRMGISSVGVASVGVLLWPTHGAMQLAQG